MTTHVQVDDGAIAGKKEQSSPQIGTGHEDKKPNDQLPALSDAEFRVMNRLATKMEYFVRICSLALILLCRY